MKKRKSILGSVVVLMVAVLIVSCATKPYVPTEDEPLYGTWVNEEGGMTIYYPDGTGKSYAKKSDPEPLRECRFIIEEKWTDREGNIYYHVLAKWSLRPYDESRTGKWYVSIKIQPSGNIMESVGYQGTQYEEIRPGDPRYTIRYRQ